jgi:hypothetical protein
MKSKTPIGDALYLMGRLMANESKKDEITPSFMKAYDFIETLQIKEHKSITDAYSEGWRNGRSSDVDTITKSPNSYYVENFDGLKL